MAKKTVSNNKTSISKLPNDKPVMYKIKTEGGNVNYVRFKGSGAFFSTCGYTLLRNLRLKKHRQAPS